ncbi:MAG: hypothetical protein JJE05_09950 [Actinobacteria bacterium]|nr:hypothetical protein [Actinomycetota bacterium]
MIQLDLISHLSCTAHQVERLRQSAPPRFEGRKHKNRILGRTDKRDLRVTDGLGISWYQ